MVARAPLNEVVPMVGKGDNPAMANDPRTFHGFVGGHRFSEEHFDAKTGAFAGLEPAVADEDRRALMNEYYEALIDWCDRVRQCAQAAMDTPEEPEDVHVVMAQFPPSAGVYVTEHVTDKDGFHVQRGEFKERPTAPVFIDCGSSQNASRVKRP